MTLSQQIEQQILQAVQQLYAHVVTEGQISLQPTKKEFVGDYTLVVFPLVKLSGKRPEETAEELGQWLVEHSERITSYNVIKGFLNLSLNPRLWIQQFQKALDNAHYGTNPVKDDAELYMVEYSSPNTNKPLHLGHEIGRASCRERV